MKKVQISLFTALAIALLAMVFPIKSSIVSSEKMKKHTVREGESIWHIAIKHGVPILDLKKVNDNDNNVAEPGETFKIPQTMSAEDKELLSRLVHAEAKGEPYQGKVAVAAVVLNRVQHEDFPDTVREVIYQDRQFSPVADGSIKEPAGEDAKRAVNHAIAIQGYTYKELYFFNPDISDSKWMRQREIVRVIGGHHFGI